MWLFAHVCPCVHAVCNELKNGASTNVLAPSAGLTGNPLCPVSLRKQVPGIPRCKPHPTPKQGKRLRGSPTSPPTPSEEGEAQSFPISSALDAPDPECYVRRYTWTCLLGKPDPFTHLTTLIQKMTRRTRLPFYHDHYQPWVKTKGENAW